MLHRLAKFTALCALALGAQTAHTQVRYDFVGFETQLIEGYGTFASAFSWTAPDFVAFADVPAGELTHCVITSSVGPASCGGVNFTQEVFQPGGPYLPAIFVGAILAPGRVAVGYVFQDDLDAFDRPGTYVAAGGPNSAPGMLTVSIVPEPATATALVIGLGLIGVWRRLSTA